MRRKSKPFDPALACSGNWPVHVVGRNALCRDSPGGARNGIAAWQPHRRSFLLQASSHDIWCRERRAGHRTLVRKSSVKGAPLRDGPDA